jgi:hypothetical protein
MVNSFTARRFGRLIIVLLVLVAATGIRRASAAGDYDSLDGVYTVSGTQPDGIAYTGSLTVAEIGTDSNDNSTYSLTWTIGGNEVSGLAIYHDGLLSGGYGSEGCGLVTYTIHSDGKLAGTWADLADQEFGIEIATIESGATLGQIAGNYAAAGISGEGEAYNTTLSIQGQGLLYSLTWADETQVNGVGILEWQGLSAVYGSAEDKCGIVSYTVTDNYELLGIWATAAQGQLGTEVATLTYEDTDETFYE